MDLAKAIISPYLARANLDTTKMYQKVDKVNGQEILTPVGKFVRCYRMGSGDGMTIHWEFELLGNKITIDDDMWASRGNQAFVGFREV